MRVGLTGGIASGKSTVLAFFKACGAATVDADVIARQVVEPGTVGLKRIEEHFGKAYVRADGRLDREKLGRLIFSDTEKRKALNDLLHPLIRAEIERQMAQLERQTPERPVIADIPLLVENGLTDWFRRMIVVYVPEEIQLRRLMRRNGWSEQEAKQRIAAQMPLKEKKKYADYVIDNSGSLENTKQQVERIWGCLCREIGQVDE